MAEVLVLVDHAGGHVRKTTSELLTIARRLGEPSAVFVGDGYDEAKATLGAFGAQKVYRAESADLVDYLVVPRPSCWPSWSRRRPLPRCSSRRPLRARRSRHASP